MFWRRKVDPPWMKYIPEFGEQLKKPHTLKIDLSIPLLDPGLTDFTFLIDYRVASIPRLEREGLPPIVLITGWNSGWEWISELGFFLALHGFKIIFISWPGTGNSSDPPKCYYEHSGFHLEASILEKVVRLLDLEKIIIIGHSMGALIGMDFARTWPLMVHRLVCLSAPMERKGKLRQKIWLAMKFPISGGIQQIDDTLFYPPSPIGYLQQYFLPQPRGGLAPGRRKQRLWEIKRLCEYDLQDKLCDVNTKIKCPIGLFWGSRDFVCPPPQLSVLRDLHTIYGFYVKVIPYAWHNTTKGCNTGKVAGEVVSFLMR